MKWGSSLFWGNNSIGIVVLMMTWMLEMVKLKMQFEEKWHGKVLMLVGFSCFED